MTIFTNGFVTLKTPEGFDVIPNKGDFVELSLVNSTIPMNIKFSITPTLAGLPDIKNAMEEQLESNPKIDVQTADFIAINEDIYCHCCSNAYRSICVKASRKDKYCQLQNIFQYDDRCPDIGCNILPLVSNQQGFFIGKKIVADS